eukprot:CAMPEP_0115587706 /NCGR_PEP_ID=MMETSP0272-20121206/8342_1 /TAXON_ID=71861 /ORGANISM="Scrippsiella trochoidea, Strain CCMP3099" /LENGTH=71 /DNA_ID=CAMNT_0003022789 /DNA_START=665 /DNA_END=880 /DNA_ORIENTATION=+
MGAVEHAKLRLHRCQAEVAELDLAPIKSAQQEVIGLQVPMHDSLAMHVRHSQQHLPEDLRKARLTHRSGRT